MAVPAFAAYSVPLDDTEALVTSDDAQTTSMELNTVGVNTGANCMELPADMVMVSGLKAID